MARLISGERAIELAALHQRAARAAGGYRALGIGEGGAVALMLRNDFAFFEASMAAALVGAYATPLNWHFTAEEAGYILRDSDARALVVHADLWPQIAAGVPEGIAVFAVPVPPEIRGAYGLGPAAGEIPAGTTAWEDWLDRQTPLAGATPPPRASMIYTSGTTGRPKGVRRQPMTPELAAANEKLVAHVFGLVPGAEATVLMNGPMYHSAPNAYGLGSVRVGASIVLQARFDAEEMLALIERHRVSHMHVVPTMFVRLLKLPDAVRARYDLSSLRFVVHGAAPCPPPVKRAMIEWWGPVIHEYYGSTETGIPAWISAAESLAHPGAAGRVLDGATIKIFDDAGRELPPGEVGEVYVRANYVPDFTYQRLDAMRREVARGDLVTVGDVGFLDGEGYLYLCDRKRDMVISGGVNIYPAEIEAALVAHPAVKDCAVFGIPDEEFGESLCAHVELQPGQAATADEIRAHLAGHLAKFKIPKTIVFATTLPREDSGKIFKRKLRAPYWEKTGRAI
jgi:long-chain acyl-CoA synthetase